MAKELSLPTFGRKGHLTPEQKTILENFQKFLIAEKKIDDKRHDEMLYLRFLRARKFDLEPTKQMFIASEKWREEFKVDTLVNDFQFPEGDQIRAIYPQYYHKVDKLGRPIYIEHFQSLDFKKIQELTTMERMQQRHVVEYEQTIRFRFPACSKKAGQEIEQSCTILDLQGVSLFSFSQVASFVRNLSKISQDYYPESLGNMFIINAPMLFSSIWSLIKPFLDEVTVNKIKIIGSNYKSTLFEYIDPENLPERLGGTCKCSEGCEKSDAGPWQEYTPAEIQAIVEQRVQALVKWIDDNKGSLAAPTATQ